MARTKYIIWIFNENQEKEYNELAKINHVIKMSYVNDRYFVSPNREAVKEYLERKKPKYAIVRPYDGELL